MNRKTPTLATVTLLGLLATLPTAEAQPDLTDTCTTAQLNANHNILWDHDEEFDTHKSYAEQWAAYDVYAVEALCIILSEIGKCHKESLCTARACDIVSDYTWSYNGNQNVVITSQVNLVPQVVTFDIAIDMYWMSPPLITCVS